MGKDYYLGLDMGTSSVGWAVTDSQYNLLRRKGKDLWGIREFEEAKTSVDRRTNRVSRRAHQRHKIRMAYVRNYFADAINEVDPSFYQRLDNSKYHIEDKDEEVRYKNALFNDVDFDDKSYYEKYPTIYHLRVDLMDNHNAHDVRLVYLAIANMFKHRGHFLNESVSSEDDGMSDGLLYSQFVELADSLLNISFKEGASEDIMTVLSDRKLTKTAKYEKIKDICGIDKSEKKNLECIKAICGRSFSPKVLFEMEDIELKSITFDDFSYDEKEDEYESEVGSDNYQVIEILKQLYDKGVLSGILKGNRSLSHARVAEYYKHHEDLMLLKKVYRKHLSQEEYDSMFRSEEDGSYSAYVNSDNSSRSGENGKSYRRSYSNRKREDLYKRINKDLKDYSDDKDVQYILGEIKESVFLPKQLTAGNGIIPNQVHAREMKVILDNASKYLDFLNAKDESGLTVSERILQLFSFHLPYYIGPVSENSKKYGGNGWVVRKEDGPVLPWNIDEKIDVAKTSEGFIKRLIRECTYISGEKVLPKNSLIYEKYRVLNEINNIRVRGERITVGLKQDIYNELFLRGKRVTRKQLLKYINGRMPDQISDNDLTGVDNTIANSLSTYGKFYSIFGEKMKTDEYKSMCEDIVYWSTVYGDARNLLDERIVEINEKHNNVMDSDTIKRIRGFKFKDWGRFSRRFLEMNGCDISTGEIKSIIRALWETNYNLMELINSEEFTYKKELEDKKKKAVSCLNEFKAEDLDEYYFSAPVKRMIWQTLLVIKELEHVMGCPPKRVFIEMTRSEEEKGDKGRKDSRKKQLIELYQNIKDEDAQWISEIKARGESGELRSKKLYLYYLQMGKCVYTGNPIDLDELMSNSNNKYDIDHIYPRHFVKDDNILNNLVLVEKESNAYKSDRYPIEKVEPKAYELWKALRTNNLMSEEKYKRLTCRKEFTEEQKAGFIARQLVETSQGTKGVAELLKSLMPEPYTKVVYAKGSNVSSFRHKFKLLKSRSVNDFHHAQDAYLNIVVGNVYFTKFTQNPMNFIKKEYALDKEKNNYHLGKMFDKKVERNGEIAWIPSKNDDEQSGTIITVKKMMAKNTPLLTRMNFEQTGAIANATLYSAKKASSKNYIPFKSSDGKMQDVEKYGGFTSVSGAYFFLVEHEVKNRRIRTLEMVPIYKKEQIEKKEDGLLQYCIDDLHLKEPIICTKKLKIQSLYQINGYRVCITGRTGQQIILRNATSLFLDQKWINYIHDIDKYIDRKVVNESLNCEDNIELYDLLLDKHSNGVYRKKPNSMGDVLADKRDLFINLQFEEQIKSLYEIVKLTEIGPAIGDLTLLNESKYSGKMRNSKNISNTSEFLLINQSVTGLYENIIDLKTV